MPNDSRPLVFAGYPKGTIAPIRKAASLHCPNCLCLAYAVLTLLIGGGVAEWLKAAVCEYDCCRPGASQLIPDGKVLCGSQSLQVTLSPFASCTVLRCLGPTLGPKKKDPPYNWHSALSLSGSGEMTEAEISKSLYGAGVALFGDGARRAGLDLRSDGDPSFSLYGAKGRDRANMQLDSDSAPSLCLNDAIEARAVLGSVYLKDPTTGTTEHRLPSSLVLFNQNGKVLWSAS
jgi:hypothetical protein